MEEYIAREVRRDDGDTPWIRDLLRPAIRAAVEEAARRARLCISGPESAMDIQAMLFERGDMGEVGAKHHDR